MIWRLAKRDIDLSRKALLLGILNVTPDSFSDGGQHFSSEAATAHARELLEAGADIIDVGGESTRPGSEPVPVEEELQRVIPVIKAIRRGGDGLISVDTSKAEVARQALEAGADIINDVTALTGDPAMTEVARKSRAGVILMHMQGKPKSMQVAPSYTNVVSEVREFLNHRLQDAVCAGIDRQSIALDPGIGFGKLPEHNAALIRHLHELTDLERPILVGHSRKSFLGWLADSQKMEDRYWNGIALTALCRQKGARLFRVHDPKPHREAVRMTEAIFPHA